MTLINSTSNALTDHPSSEMYTKHRCIFKCLCTFWGIHKNTRELCKLGISINIPKKCCNMHNTKSTLCWSVLFCGECINPAYKSTPAIKSLELQWLNWNTQCAFRACFTWTAGNEWIRCSIFLTETQHAKKDEWFSYFAPSVFLVRACTQT